MRRVLTVLALVLAMAGLSAPAYAAPATRGATPTTHQRTATSAPLVIERLASPVHLVSPGVDPEPMFREVTVFGRVRGCVPGELYVVHARFFQHRREITGVAGGLGFEEFACGADGTARIRQSRYDPMNRLHAGCLRVTFQVMPFDQGSVLGSTSARVRIPRA
jgi:hypothetical protein